MPNDSDITKYDRHLAMKDEAHMHLTDRTNSRHVEIPLVPASTEEASAFLLLSFPPFLLLLL